MHNTQTFLRAIVASGGTQAEAFAQLTAGFGISVRVYPEDNIALLDYSQIDSPKSNPIVIECRSLIVNATTFAVVSRKFDRFFNAGECPDYYHDFDLSRSVVMAKEDGSLIGIYHNGHTNRWEISTRGMAKAEGPHAFGGTFRDKVLGALGVTEDEFQAVMDSTIAGVRPTFVMEYCSPENRIVTKYDTPQMVLLAVTNATEECQPASLPAWMRLLTSAGLKCRVAEIYPVRDTLAQLIDDANQLKDLKEGFVVFDPVSGKRIKIKSATYLVCHKLRGNDPVPTRKNLLELVLEGEVDEFLAYFPEWTDLVNGIRNEIDVFTTDMNRLWVAVKSIDSQKEFASCVIASPASGYLFTARKLGITPTEAFRNAKLLTKQKTFGV
jgi:hypothetical protein